MKTLQIISFFALLFGISCQQGDNSTNKVETNTNPDSYFKIDSNITAFKSFDLKKLEGIGRLNNDSISYPYVEIKSTKDSLILHCFVDEQIDKILNFKRNNDLLLMKEDSYEEFGRVINHHILKDSGTINIMKVYYRSDTTLTRPRTEVNPFAQTIIFEYSNFQLNLEHPFIDSIIKVDSDTIINEKIDQSKLDINSTDYNRLVLTEPDDFWHYFFCERFGECEHWD